MRGAGEGAGTITAGEGTDIALTPEWERWVYELVASGDYQSASEVIRAGLGALRHSRERHAAELAEIETRLHLALAEADAGAPQPLWSIDAQTPRR